MSVLSDAAASMSPGQWLACDGLSGRPNLRTGLTNSLLAAEADGSSQITWIDNLVYDRYNKQVLFFNDSSHGSPKQVIRFREDVGADGTWDKFTGGFGGYHNYDSVLSVHRGGSEHLWWPGFGGHAADYFASLDSMFILPNFAGSNSTMQELVGTTFVSRGPVLPTGDDGNAYLANLSTYAVTTLTGWNYKPGGGGLGYHSMVCHSPVTDRLIYGGGNGARRVTFRVTRTLVRTQNNDAPFDLDAAYGAILISDPVTGDILGISNKGAFAKMNPLTGVWTNLPNPTVPAIGGFDSNGNCGIGGPIPAYGVVMFLRHTQYQDNAQVFLYKHAPQAVSPPIAPTSLRVVS